MGSSRGMGSEPTQEQTGFRLISRRALIAVTAAVWLAFGLLLAVYLFFDRAKEIRYAEENARDYAQLLAQHAGRTIQSVDSSLRLVIAQYDKLRAEGRTDGASLNQLLVQAKQDQPSVRSMTIFDSRGLLIGDSESPTPRQLAIADRDHFRVARDKPNAGLDISVPLRARVDGRWTIYLARGLRDIDGNFIGVAVASVQPEYFANFYGSFEQIEGLARIALVRGDGVILAAYPQAENEIGSRFQRLFPDSILFDSKVTPNDLCVIVELDRNALLTDWRGRVVLLAAVALLSGLLLLVLARQVARRINEADAAHRAMAQAEQRFRDGLSAMDDGFAIFDADDRLILCNARYRDCFPSAAQLLEPGVDYQVIMRAVSSTDLDLQGEDIASWRRRRIDYRENPGRGAFTFRRRDGRLLAITDRPTSDGGRVSVVSDITEREDRAAALTRSNVLLQAVFDGVIQGIWAFDEDRKLVAWNRQVEVLLELPEGFLRRGMDLGEVQRFGAARGDYGPGDPAEHLARRRRETATHALHNIERVSPSGRIVLARGGPMLNGGFVSTFTDISEQREREAALESAHALLRAVFDSVTQGIWAFDRNGRLVAWNETMGKVLDAPPGLLCEGRSFREIQMVAARRGDFGPGDPDDLVDNRGSLERARQPHLIENELADGRTIQIRGGPMPGGGFVSAVTDITEQKRHEREVEAQTVRFKAIFDNVLDAIITINESGGIESFNPAAERLFGYRAEDVLRRNVKLLVAEPHSSAHDGYLRRYLQTGERHVIGRTREMTARRADGSQIDVDLSVNEYNLGGQRLFVGILRDISERKEVERMKREFVSVVSHELRTPLTAIAGALDLLGTGVMAKQPGQTERLVEIARNNSHRLIRLVNDILDIEKIEAGTVALTLEPILVEELIDGAVEANRAFAAGFRVELEIGAIADAQVRGDFDRLIQVLTNLISNACKHSPSEGTVTVAVERRGDQLHFSIKDQGPGVPEEFRSRIFERFAQADSSDRRRKGGTGLGLSIAKSIVERHGGRIGYDSTLGAGAVFWFDLPVWGGAMRPVAPKRAAAVTRRGTILHIEDDPEIVELLRQSLAGIAELIAASSLAEARLALAEERFDAVVLDIGLTDGHARELLPVFDRLSPAPALYVFSGQQLDAEIAGRADLVLVKAQEGLVELVELITDLLARERPE
ncbi:MAG: PAS-domain containing protein [Ferrovibrionaceae bacterium]